MSKVFTTTADKILGNQSETGYGVTTRGESVFLVVVVNGEPILTDTMPPDDAEELGRTLISQATKARGN